MSNRCALLKPGKEKSLERRHPWIFSGAIASLPPDIQPGELLPVFSHAEKWLALAYFHSGHSLTGRVLSFENIAIEELLEKKFSSAAALRKELIDCKRTNGFRLINAEGDGLPGLIVDRYGDTLVIQLTTQGMERLRPLIIKGLVQQFSPLGIFEKSRGSARLQEGLEQIEGHVWGRTSEQVEIRENDLRFLVSLEHGQKTGFFFDQREMRNWVASRAKDKRVLNGFSYTGGFSVAALRGGAAHVDSVDICSHAIELLEKNMALNGFSQKNHAAFCEDLFDFLTSRSLKDYDLIILDPPAFAKKRNDVENACRGYKQLMRSAMQGARSGAFLLISSCSYYMDELLFQNLAAQAACEANRSVRIISSHIQASDHPVSLAHPEGRYLKSLILQLA